MSMQTHPSPPDDARVAELAHAYLDAEYRWLHHGSWPELRIAQPAPELERSFPDLASFGLLSAWNPMSCTRDDDTNRHQDDLLHQALADAGHLLSPAFSSARNRTWREPGWLVHGMDTDRFDALARRFGQLGTLWWNRGEPVQLRMDARRPAGFADAAHVHWLR